MKTKLTLLITALAFAGLANAGPDLQTQQMRKQIADSQRASLPAVSSSSGRVNYVPSPSGKGGIVAKQDRSQGTTNIALFKSKKAACCEKR